MLRRLALKAARIFWFLPAYLLWTAFPPSGESLNVLFALAPLMWLSRRAPLKKAVRLWFLNGLGFWIATLSWMPAIIKNGGPWYLVALGWAALSAYCALYFALYGYLSSKVWSWVCVSDSYSRRLFAIFVAEPVLFAGLELVRSRLGGGFAWNQLGVAPVMAGFGAPASLGGVYLLSALVVLVNGTIAGIAERVWKDRMEAFAVPRWARSVETFAALAVVWMVFRLAPPPQDPADPQRIPVALFQRNFPCCFSKSRPENPLDVYKSLSSSVAPFSPAVAVLPESALMEFGKVDSRSASDFAERLMDATGAKVVVAGGNRRDAEGREYNSSGVFARGEVPQIYDKVHLVPFGEFIPMDKTFTFLQQFAPVGSCTPGELKTVVLPLKREVPAGIAICFEDTDSAQVRTLARMGAEVLVFITNDSWFSHSEEPQQHAWQSVARALETGLPVLRSGNSGVTGVVFPDGRRVFLSDGDDLLVDRCGAMVEIVDVGPRPATWYVRLGDKPLFAAFSLLVAAMVCVKIKRRRENAL